jgi:MOSC domain-containing protein YiiM
MLNERQMAALLVSHGRPGFYFRVLEEGEVGSGDEILKVKAGPERMTVAEINALLYLPGHPASGLERALRIPALSAGWRTSLEAFAVRQGPEAALSDRGSLPLHAGRAGGYRPG